MLLLNRIIAPHPTPPSPSLYHPHAGTLYVFICVCSGTLHNRYHQAGSGSSARPVLAILLAMILMAVGELLVGCWCHVASQGRALAATRGLGAVQACASIALASCQMAQFVCSAHPAPAGFSLSYTFDAGWPAVLAFLLLFGLAAGSLYLLPVRHVPEKFRVPLFPATPSLGILFTVSGSRVPLWLCLSALPLAAVQQ